MLTTGLESLPASEAGCLSRGSWHRVTASHVRAESLLQQVRKVSNEN